MGILTLDKPRTPPNIGWKKIVELLDNLIENPSGTDRPLWRDVSHWAGDLNMDVMKINGVMGIFIKAGQGVGWVDDMFDINWQKALDAGLMRSPYFFYMGEQDPVAQFDNLTNICRIHDLIPPVLDFENNYVWINGDYVGLKHDWKPDVYTVSRKGVADNIWKFCCLVESHYGVWPIMYSRKNVIDFWLKSWSTKQLNTLYYWLALYNRNRAIEHPGEPPAPDRVEYERVILHQTADLKAGFIGETTSKDIDWNRWEIGTEKDALAFIAAEWGGDHEIIKPIKKRVRIHRGRIRHYLR